MAEEAVQDTIHDIKQKLSHAAEAIQHEAGQKVKRNISPRMTRHSPRVSSDLPSEPENVEPIVGPGPGVSAHQAEDIEEEGWMSDRSGSYIWDLTEDGRAQHAMRLIVCKRSSARSSTRYMR